MLHKYASLGWIAVLLVACTGDSDADSGGTGLGGANAAGGTTATGGASGAGGASSGGASGLAGSSAGGASGLAGSSAGGESGLAGSSAGDASGSTDDAAIDGTPVDATGDVVSAPQCLGINEACSADGGTCCEAYVCRSGTCCVPTGVWSNCLTNSDCCSNSCVLRQCTCVPRGYSCTGPGQCCSGFACQNGTCICPPDIRGCT
jgi:hypothetical protein